jgi:hypothetical protein
MPMTSLATPCSKPPLAPRGTVGAEVASEAVVSFQTPLPAPLFKAMGHFIEGHPQWDQYRLLQAALSGFLLQQGVKERTLTRRYIGSMFGRA